MPIVTPIFRDNVEVIAPTFLSKSDDGIGDSLTTRAVLDLRSSYSAMLSVVVFCHSYTVIPKKGITVSVRRLINGTIVHPAGTVRYSNVYDPDGGFSLTAATAGNTSFEVSGEGQEVGSTVILYNFALNFSNIDLAKIVRNDTPTLYIDSPLQNSFAVGRVVKKAEVFPPFNVQGGSYIEVVADISDADPAIWGVRVLANIYDGDRTT